MATIGSTGILGLYDHELLAADEETRLFRTYRSQPSAALRERLILANTRLVRSIADELVRQRPTGALTLDDLRQEGMMGLMIAIEKFDPERGLKFSTHATWWIRQAITRAFENQAQLIREPSWVQTKRSKHRRHGSSGDEAADSDADADMAPAWQLVSLDEPRWPHDGDDETWADCLPAPESETTSVAEMATNAAYWHSTLYQALGQLSSRERNVVELRYGLTNGGDCWTLVEVGKVMNGISRERVRQIEAAALRKLRLALACSSEGELAVRLLDDVAAARRKRAQRTAARRARDKGTTTRNEKLVKRPAPIHDQPRLAS